jgi:hypothetical protein
MRKTPAILLIALFSSVAGLNAFVDRSDIDREMILSRIDALKVIKGVYLSGAGNVFFNASFGAGNEFLNVTRKADYNPLAQMDIVFTALPLPVLSCGADIRLQSDLSGQAFGNSVTVESFYSELTLYGFIVVKFGQLYEKLTPFTLYAPIDAVWMRSELFNGYFNEDIRLAHLRTDGTFPLEGLSLKTEFLFGETGVWGLKAMGAKIADDTTPGNSFDRFMLAANTGLKAGKDLFSGQLSWVSFHDITNTGVIDYNPPKYSGVLSAAGSINAAGFLGPLKGVLKGLGVEGEAARSTWNEDVFNSNYTNGLALSGNLFVNILDLVKLKAGTRYVEYEFVAPGAQTRMLTPRMAGSMFVSQGYYGWNGLQLLPSLSDVGLRRGVQFTRDNNNILDFATAMNEATPNRNGLFGSLALDHRFGRLYANAGISREIRPVGAGNADNPRELTRIEGEASLVLSEILKVPQLPKFSAFYVYETDTRPDLASTATNDSEDLAINVLGAEIVIPVTKKLRLVGTYQTFSVKGLKWVDGYDEASQNALAIAGFMRMDYDIVESVMGGGLIWNLAKPITFRLDYTLRSCADKSANITSGVTQDVSYEMHQARLLMHIIF